MCLRFPFSFNVLYYATFGANRRSILYALLIEGITLFSILSLSERGYLHLPEIPNLTELVLICIVLILVAMFFIVKSISKETFSPRLQHRLIQINVVVWYVLVGLSAVGVGFVLSSYLNGDLSYPTRNEFVIGAGISTTYGLLILIYYDRHEVNPPNKKDEFQRLGNEFLAKHKSLTESNRSPLQLTDNYNAILCTGDELVELLENAETPDGKELYNDLKEWSRAFNTHKEPAQDMVIKGGNNPDDTLQKEHENLSDITKRINQLTEQ